MERMNRRMRMRKMRRMMRRRMRRGRTREEEWRCRALSLLLLNSEEPQCQAMPYKHCNANQGVCRGGGAGGGG